MRTETGTKVGRSKRKDVMTQINAALVKALRDKTGAGVIACKRALIDANGDFDRAVVQLGETDHATVAARADRVAAAGLVAVAMSDTLAAIVELNSETDFVARSEVFRETARAIATEALAAAGSLEALLERPGVDGHGRVSDMVARLTARTGEHIELRRTAVVSVSRGVIESYVHNAIERGLGSIGVLLAIESAADPRVVSVVGHTIAMHIAASSPQWISTGDVPADVVEDKRAELTAEARQTAKPAPVVEKMVDGRMRKFREQVVLHLQPYVLNPDQTVAQALEEAEKTAGAPISIHAFVRFQVGEGIAGREQFVSRREWAGSQ
jgi:elongation factor Ts